ncbi:MAG: nucleotidyltransferase, partial [bacterium]|nr:nucleotidyltransferase [bacterium]
MFDSAEAQLAALLQGTVEQLDISPRHYREAVDKYHQVAEFLGAGDEYDDADLLIYPQGSFRLGTVVLPAPGADYDIDLVLRVAIAKEATTQAELKELAGQRLTVFVKRTSGAPKLIEGGRCWTLLWPRFHVDILPSLPNPEDLPNGILLTDRDLRLWQLSNPIGYADWFQSRMREQFLQQRKILAADRSTTVDDVPQWEVKTTLQQAVQVLKRHRDLHFANQLHLKPPSILVTTLVGLAYGGHDDLFEA